MPILPTSCISAASRIKASTARKSKLRDQGPSNGPCAGYGHRFQDRGIPPPGKCGRSVLFALPDGGGAFSTSTSRCRARSARHLLAGTQGKHVAPARKIPPVYGFVENRWRRRPVPRSGCPFWSLAVIIRTGNIGAVRARKARDELQSVHVQHHVIDDDQIGLVGLTHQVMASTGCSKVTG